VRPRILVFLVTAAAASFVLSLLAPVSAEALWGISVGSQPRSVSVDSSNGYVYVANAGSNTVSVISTSSNTVVNTTALTGQPTDLVAVPSFGKVYVAVPGKQIVAVLATDGSLITTIPTGKKTKPTFVEADEARGLLYVANQQEKRVMIVDMNTDTVLSRFAALVTADGLGFSVSLNRIFVSDNNTGQLLAFDPDTATQVGSVSFGTPATHVFVDDSAGVVYVALPNRPGFAVVGASDLVLRGTVTTISAPGGFAVDSAGSTLLVTYSGSSSVGFFDTSTYMERRRVSVGTAPAGLDIFVPGARAYVANSGSNTVSMLDLAGGYGFGYADTARQPVTVAVDEANDRMFVGHYEIVFDDPYSLNSPLEVFQLSTGAPVAAIPNVGNVFPWGLAVDSAGRRVFASRTYAGTIAVISSATNTVVSEIPVGFLPRALAYDKNRQRLYVSGMFTTSVAVIDTTSLSVVGSIPVGPEAAGLALDGSTNTLFVALEGTGEVKKIDLVTSSTVSTTQVGGKPLGVALSTDGSLVYVANFDGARVDALSTSDLSVAATADISWPVHTVRASADRVAAISWEGEHIYWLDPTTLAPTGSVWGFALADGAFSSTGTQFYQTLFGDDKVMRVTIG
jgi:YVTN family beta-propeller protein